MPTNWRVLASSSLNAVRVRRSASSSLSTSWHFWQVSDASGSSAWSGGWIGVGNVPSTVCTSWRVPATLALTQPATPGDTWHSPHETSRWLPSW